MRSKFRPAVLLVLALLIGMVAAAACGGTHAGSPCCSATGAVQQPTAFAATTPTLMAEPILFPSQATSCLTFDPANGLTLPAGTSSLGAPQPVVAGRYTVKISGKAIGDQIYIRIFDAAAPKATLAVGAVPADQASHTDAADPYHVAPIAIDPLALAVDESTLELLVWCDLLQNSLAGKLTLADVRGAIPPEVAGFSPTPANLLAFRPRMQKIQSSFGDVINFPEATQLFGTTGDYASLSSNFQNLRVSAEQFVDDCRDGSPPEGTARITCSGNPADENEAEFYRAWKIAHFAAEDGVNYARPFRDHLLCWSEHIADQFGPATEAADPVGFQILRRTAMMKFEATDQALHAAATTNLGLSLTTITSVEGIMDNFVRPRLLAATSATEMAAVWTSGGKMIISSMVNDPASGFPLNDTQCAPPFINQSQNGYSNAQLVVGSFGSLTYAAKIGKLYGSASGATGFEDSFSGPLDTCAQSLVHDPVKIDGWQEIMFYLSLDGTTPP